MSIIGTRGILSGGTGTIASGDSEVVIVTDVTDPRYQPVVVVVGNDNSNVFLRALTYAAGAWKFKVAGLIRHLILSQYIGESYPWKR